MQPVIPIEQAVEYVQPDGSVYIRTGSCNRCGACCESGDPFAGEQTNPPSPCRLLGVDGAGAKCCTDRTSDVYLNGCNVWPTAPEHIAAYPDCSYVFERVS